MTIVVRIKVDWNRGCVIILKIFAVSEKLKFRRVQANHDNRCSRQSRLRECFQYVPCSPVKVPHNSGKFSALVIVKTSVAHVDAWFASTPVWWTAPFKILAVEAVSVEGPVITNVLKSNLIWQILLEQGQILVRQDPAFKLDAST